MSQQGKEDFDVSRVSRIAARRVGHLRVQMMVARARLESGRFRAPDDDEVQTISDPQSAEEPILVEVTT